MINHNRSLGIYIHIPFCVQKCRYCDFLSAPASEQVRRAYLDQLIREIRQFDGTEYTVETVFIGGGTPSLLSGNEIAEILQALKTSFKSWAQEPEITIECNPGTLTEDKLCVWHSCGVNRLSIGLQSADDRELRFLGRIHTWEDFRSSYSLARKAGFRNINVDLMSALPGQTRESWRNTLQKVLQLRPEHISAYSLIIEEGTPFWKLYGETDADCRADALQDEQTGKRYVCTAEEEAERRGKPPLPTEEEERGMYYDTERILREAGMHRYEISNYALPGYESRHNCRYWQRQEYIGFGLGASSQLGHERFRRTEQLQAYLNGDFGKYDKEELTIEDEIEETMFLGLRMMDGVSISCFTENFGKTPEQVYGKVLDKLKSLQLITEQQGRIRLTSGGIDISNSIFVEFLFDGN